MRVRQSESYSFFLYIGIAVFLFLLDTVGVTRPFQNLSDRIFYPFKKIIVSGVSSINQYISVASEYPSIKQEVSQLKLLQKKVLELEQKSGELSLQNEKLRQMLDAPLPSSWKLFPVSVLGINRAMIVSVGLDSGVKSGMTVVDGPYYIGKVLSSSTHSAKVQLPFDAESQIAVKTSRGSRGVVRGVFGEKMELEKVLQADPLFLGDSVFTTGEDGIGEGLMVGRVESIRAKDTDPYKSATIKPGTNFWQLTTVFVVVEK